MCVCKSLIIIGAHLNVLACLQACKHVNWVLELNFGGQKKILVFWPQKKSLHFGPNPCILDPCLFGGQKTPSKTQNAGIWGKNAGIWGKKAGICFFPCILDLDPCLFLAIPAFFAKRQGLEGQG